MERLIQQKGVLDNIDYTVRRSQRARHAQIKIAPSGAVTVVIPHRYSLKYVPELLGIHRDWINNQLSLIQGSYNPETDSDTPRKIILTAIGEEWGIDYTNNLNKISTRRLKLEVQDRRLTINTANSAEVKSALSSWLNKKAKTLLIEQVQHISEQTALMCEGVSIRNQKTRWGSCSAQRHLSLNRNLIFLPARSMRYLILHELCHTVHLNHSRRFWRLVERFEPDYRQLDKSLNSAKSLIPRWALPDA